MPNLFPESYDTEIIELEDIQPANTIGYKNGIAFDDELGDFIRDGKHRLVDSTGIESWKSWCINCIQTERYRHLAYGTDFGIEAEAAMKADTREASENMLTRQISEALMADPYERTEYVQEIEFDWTEPDAIAVYVVIIGKDDVTIDITAYITKGEI